MRRILLALVLIMAGRSALCPLVTCVNLDTGVCAYKSTGGGLFLTAKGCPKGTQCSAYQIYPNWWPYAYPGNSITCEEAQVVTVVTNATYVPVQCLQRLPGKNFKGGQQLVECQSDSDCELEDGTVTFGSCKCGFRAFGLGVCSPDPSNALFQGYWDQCSLTGCLEDRAAFQYWSFYMNVFSFISYNVKCAENIAEVELLSRLHMSAYGISAAKFIFAPIAIYWLFA